MLKFNINLKLGPQGHSETSSQLNFSLFGSIRSVTTPGGNGSKGGQRSREGDLKRNRETPMFAPKAWTKCFADLSMVQSKKKNAFECCKQSWNILEHMCNKNYINQQYDVHVLQKKGFE